MLLRLQFNTVHVTMGNERIVGVQQCMSKTHWGYRALSHGSASILDGLRNHVERVGRTGLSMVLAHAIVVNKG